MRWDKSTNKSASAAPHSRCFCPLPALSNFVRAPLLIFLPVLSLSGVQLQRAPASLPARLQAAVADAAALLLLNGLIDRQGSANGMCAGPPGGRLRCEQESSQPPEFAPSHRYRHEPADEP